MADDTTLSAARAHNPASIPTLRMNIDIPSVAPTGANVEWWFLRMDHEALVPM